jgi:hypothetical protein
MRASANCHSAASDWISWCRLTARTCRASLGPKTDTRVTRPFMGMAAGETPLSIRVPRMSELQRTCPAILHRISSRGHNPIPQCLALGRRRQRRCLSRKYGPSDLRASSLWPGPDGSSARMVSPAEMKRKPRNPCSGRLTLPIRSKPMRDSRSLSAPASEASSHTAEILCAVFGRRRKTMRSASSAGLVGARLYLMKNRLALACSRVAASDRRRRDQSHRCARSELPILVSKLALNVLGFASLHGEHVRHWTALRRCVRSARLSLQLCGRRSVHAEMSQRKDV